MTRAEHFYYANGVPRNRVGLDDAEVLGVMERDMSSFRLAEIHAGEAPAATSGRFDLDHLKAIHQHTFQDTYEWAGVTRSETMTIEGQVYEPAPLLWKEGSDYPFTPSVQVNSTLNATFIDLQQKNHLQNLSREDFSREAARTFSQINQAHPFMEGNGRTQREFMSQLAEQAGHPVDFEVVSGHRMNEISEQARLGDRTGLERMFQEITDPQRAELLRQAEATLSGADVDWQQVYIASATPGEHYQGIKAVHTPDMLIVKEQRDFILVAQTGDAVPSERRADFIASPYPGTARQQEVSLRGLDDRAFAQQAAQRLSQIVKAQEMTPAQVREAAAELGREAERSLNLGVMTSERVSRDMESAKQGQPQGFERMFQETGDPASSKLLLKAAENLEQRGLNPDKLYLTVAQTGQQHEGALEFKTSRVGVVTDDQGRHLATPASSLKGVSVSDEGRVQFTAREPMKVQRQLDY